MTTPSSEKCDIILKRLEIQKLFAEGHTVTEISRITNTSRIMVYKWMKKETILDKKKTGRISKITDSDKKQIELLVKDNEGVGVRTIAKLLNKQFKNAGLNKSISFMTITRYMAKANLGSNVRPVRSQKNIADRLIFCEVVKERGYLGTDEQGKELRSHILWTDESLIFLQSRIKNSDICKENSDNISSSEKSISITVAGGISSRGRTPLLVFPETLRFSAEKYQTEILPVYIETLMNKEYFPNSEKILLQQDMTPSHSSKSTTEIINQHGFLTWGKNLWPGNSADLNCIKEVWIILQESVLKEPRPKNISELSARVIETWNSIDQDYLEKLTQSFPERIEKCIKNCTKHR